MIILYFNIFITFLIVALSLLLYKSINKNRSFGGYLYYSLFWLFIAFTYFLIIIEDINYINDYIINPHILINLNQIFVACSGFFILSFLSKNLFNNEKVEKLLRRYIYLPLLLLFVVFNVYFEWHPPVISDWGAEYIPSQYVKWLFSFLMLMAMALLIINMFRAVQRQSNKKIVVNYALIFVFFITSGIDQMGAMQGWKMSFLRLVMLTAVMILYINSISYVENKSGERKIA